MSTANIIAGSLSVSSNGSLSFLTVTALGALGVGPTALTAAQVLGGFFTIAPTADAVLTLPTAAALAAAIPTTLVIGQAIEFSIQNNIGSSGTSGAIVAVPADITDGTSNAAQRTVEGWVVGSVTGSNSGSGSFLLVCTNATVPAFTLYRRS